MGLNILGIIIMTWYSTQHSNYKDYSEIRTYTPQRHLIYYHHQQSMGCTLGIFGENLPCYKELFHKSLCSLYPNLVKSCITLTSKVMMQSGHNFAHATTAELSRHVQNRILVIKLCWKGILKRVQLRVHKPFMTWIPRLLYVIRYIHLLNQESACDGPLGSLQLSGEPLSGLQGHLTPLGARSAITDHVGFKDAMCDPQARTHQGGYYLIPLARDNLPTFSTTFWSRQKWRKLVL